MDISIHEIGHMLVYFLGVFLLYLLARNYFSAKNIILGLIFSIIIDIDHLVDYFNLRGFSFDVSDFLSSDYFKLSGKVIVPLHAWEFVLLLLLFFMFFNKRDKVKHSYLLFVALGIGSHLLYDALYYGFDPSVYFLTKRALNGFNISLFDH